jgi:hypothetical protein
MTRWSRVLFVIVALGPSPVRAEPTGWPSLLSLLAIPQPSLASDPDERLWLRLKPRLRRISVRE